MNDEAYDVSKLSGRVSAWLCVVASLNGEQYVAGRIVDFSNTCRATMAEGDLKISCKPRLHVPSVSYSVDVNNGFGCMEDTWVANKRVTGMTERFWPALSGAVEFKMIDEHCSPEWCGETDGKVNVVKRFVVDFGDVDELPEIKYDPYNRLSFTRDPVCWFKAKDIVYSGEDIGGDYVSESAYSLSVSYPIKREIYGLDSEQVILIDDQISAGTIFQETVADSLTTWFGKEFFAKPDGVDLGMDIEP